MNSFLHIFVATLISMAWFGPLAQAGDSGAPSAAAPPTLVADAASAMAAIEPAAGQSRVPAAPKLEPHHDLVFGLGDANEPFFKDGVFMLGDKIIKVEQGPVPDKKMVAYDAKTDRIIVSNDKTLAEADKGAALIGLMDALSIQQIEPAAGP